jgi:hypothetical protein
VCMEGIHVDEVFAAVVRIVGKQSKVSQGDKYGKSGQNSTIF